MFQIKSPGPIAQLDTSIELPWNCNSTLRSAPRGRPRYFLDPEHLGTTGTTGTSTATLVGGLFDVTPHPKAIEVHWWVDWVRNYDNKIARINVSLFWQNAFRSRKVTLMIHSCTIHEKPHLPHPRHVPSNACAPWSLGPARSSRSDDLPAETRQKPTTSTGSKWSETILPGDILVPSFDLHNLRGWG